MSFWTFGTLMALWPPDVFEFLFNGFGGDSDDFSLRSLNYWRSITIGSDFRGRFNAGLARRRGDCRFTRRLSRVGFDFGLWHHDRTAIQTEAERLKDLSQFVG